MQQLQLDAKLDSINTLRLRDVTPTWSGQTNLTRYQLRLRYAGGVEMYWEKNASPMGELRGDGLVIHAADLAARAGMNSLAFKSGPLHVSLTAIGSLMTNRKPTHYTVFIPYATTSAMQLQVRQGEGARWQDVSPSSTGSGSMWVKLDNVEAPYTEWQLLLHGQRVDGGQVMAEIANETAVAVTSQEPIGYVETTLMLFANERRQWADLCLNTLAGPQEQSIVLPNQPRQPGPLGEPVGRLGYIGSLLRLLETTNCTQVADVQTATLLLTRIQHELLAWPH
ncbi:hypothetical protein FAES_3243 [Fibrella aestuarina BUZ 2]|uniref:Uncharacterized protein n=1 Tax=Fibrella aestuarina BUZ 2 TaxID=1166018 RepID=I0KAU9_9BACT|nr:hypothetical protein [Fibrella aestuarina]CCH01252.1 hypothetical protein FAES_3243 [Fibrella aestuarina BUZ 2]